MTDKDGPWANLLVMDMLAYYGTRAEKPLSTLAEMGETVHLPGYGKLWHLYGPDLQRWARGCDLPLEAKEGFINYYLDLALNVPEDELRVAGLKITYLGGIRYELVEMQLMDDSARRPPLLAHSCFWHRADQPHL